MFDAPFLDQLTSDLEGLLPLWGLAPRTEVALHTVSENATFFASDPEVGRRIVLRVHRPGYHRRDEIRSELAWITALIAEGVVDTPRPVPMRDGSLVAAVGMGSSLRDVVAFEFMTGREPTPEKALVPWFEQLGAITARLHGHARRWSRPEGFSRKIWDFDAMLGSRRLWGDWRCAIGLQPDERDLLERTALALQGSLDAYGKGEKFGLVHADLRLANLLAEPERLGVIDFDDCGFSWFLYDFAAAISFIETDSIVPDLEAAWLEGYRRVAPLSPEDEAMLPVFVMLRRILLTAWLASHPETPTAREIGATYTAGTADLAEAFLTRTS
ncbi:phosphotransferase enzyme family protein [Aurantimonas sp. VKM B-3413]|uniref:phosphotransferase enzyme family protein n=1 Tax=Aurantimonas sp. VKM B-3413 TaxID=2779401 RepID=UPI001E2B5AF2|nr:phosphotransferase [Aurantimonas sp. VKM B-3413]MCB8838613.1 phosphotransferase [Aurantimonas sp. VKM B-3413]